MDLNNPDRIGKLKAVSLKAGDIVDYDPWYAQELLDSGMAASTDTTTVDSEEVPSKEMTRVNDTEAARRLFNKYGIDPAEVHGSGVGGRITAKDVMAYLHQPVHEEQSKE